MDGGSQRHPADRLGRGRHPVRSRRGPHRPHAHAHADDAAVRARHGGVRAGDEHVDADGVSRGGQPRHRRRMGGGRGDGRRGRARKTACGSGRAALHVRAAGIVSGEVRQLDHRGRSPERESVDVVAVCVPVRPDPRGGRVRRAHLRQRTRALEAGRGINGASAHPRAVHARAPARDAERLRDGGDRPHHLVDRQRLHPDRLGGARRGARGGAGPRSRGDAGAQGGVAEHRNRCIQRRRPARHVADHPRRQDDGTPKNVRHLFRPVGHRGDGHLRARSAARRRASTCTSSSASPCSACSAASRITCPSCFRRGCAGPAPGSATTSAASSPPAVPSWSGRSHRAAASTR